MVLFLFVSLSLMVFSWLGAYGSFIPFSISGFGSRTLLVFTVFSMYLSAKYSVLM